MNIVNSGNSFQIYGNDLQTFKSLPVGSYEVCFDPMAGYSLIARPDLIVNDDKIYGNHQRKITKVIQSYALSNRNFGIILSGAKGIGKSIFARLLAQEAIKQKMPVIMVNKPTPGLPNFISSIEQECLVIFDEFEKTFGREEEEGRSNQESMLSLFDGLDNGKKLFCITCNNPDDLSSFLLNRPGRFHYHFALSAPTPTEIREYMTDKVSPEFAEEIDRVIKFAQTVDITYDLLRAIAFELNQGYSLKEAMEDLNISNETTPHFDVIAITETGDIFRAYYRGIDIYDDRPDCVNRVVINDSSFEPTHELVLIFTSKDIEVTEEEITINPSTVNVVPRYTNGDSIWTNGGVQEVKKSATPPKFVKIILEHRNSSYTDKYLVS